MPSENWPRICLGFAADFRLLARFSSSSGDQVSGPQLGRSILADLRIPALLDSSTNPQLKYWDDPLRAVRPSFYPQNYKEDVDASSDCY
jgi:hypothetical protein